MPDNDERVAVSTYVPAYQRERWREHADELDMSQSEFVRTMVQAGRRGFDPEPEEGRSSDQNPRGNGLKDRVLEVLREDPYLDWEALVASLTDDFENRLEEALEELQESNRVRYSGRHGGYTLVNDGE